MAFSFAQKLSDNSRLNHVMIEYWDASNCIRYFSLGIQYPNSLSTKYTKRDAFDLGIIFIITFIEIADFCLNKSII